MTRQLLTRIVLGLLATMAPLQAQSTNDAGYPPRKCEAPKVPVGYLTGDGILQYRMSVDGRPDTTTLSVVRVNGISAAGFRSAAARLLSNCRMDLSLTPHPAEPFLVHQPLQVDSASVSLAPASPAQDSYPPVSETLPFVMTAIPLELTDPRLEEQPRTLTCQPPLLPGRTRERTSTSQQQADSAATDYARRLRGRLRARIIVLPDGRVDADQIQVLESTNPDLKASLLASIASCQFAPGRSGGIPVAAYTTTGTSVRGESP
ncbi:MAG: hypothetical protein ABI587_16520 [Gemmatimonadales bacterium]